MKKFLVTLGVLALVLIVSTWLGSLPGSWSQSPIMTPSAYVYVPMILNNYDQNAIPTPTPTPLPLPKLQGVGHDRKWEQDEADWLCPALELSGVSWYYDWSPYPIQCAGVEAVPMIWDASQISVPIQGNSEYLQVFSEPDFQSQANMTPVQAVPYYMQVEQMYLDMKLVGPAIWQINCLYDEYGICVDTIGWLDDFWDAYGGDGPRMDAVAIHLYPQLVSYYSSPANHIAISQMKVDAAVKFAEDHNIPEVWVTEFCAQPIASTYQGSIDYMTGMIAIFESEPLVTRYAWFGLDLTGFWYWPTNPELSALYDTSLVLEGELTPLGEAYYNVVSP